MNVNIVVYVVDFMLDTTQKENIRKLVKRWLACVVLDIFTLNKPSPNEHDSEKSYSCTYYIRRHTLLSSWRIGGLFSYQKYLLHLSIGFHLTKL